MTQSAEGEIYIAFKVQRAVWRHGSGIAVLQQANQRLAFVAAGGFSAVRTREVERRVRWTKEKVNEVFADFIDAGCGGLVVEYCCKRAECNLPVRLIFHILLEEERETNIAKILMQGKHPPIMHHIATSTQNPIRTVSTM